MSSTEEEPRVKFPDVDPKEEEERTKRGWEHRKDLVRGIKYQQENVNKHRAAQTEYGYTWLCDESRTVDELNELDLCTRLTIEGFLVNYLGTTTRSASLAKTYEEFQNPSKPKQSLDELNFKLKEQLALIAILLSDNEHGIPMSVDDPDGKLMTAADTD